MSILSAVIVSTVVTAVTVLAAGPVLRRLPLPRTHPGPDRPWDDLPRPGWLAATGAASLFTGAIGLVLAPAATAPLWLVWAAPVTLLVAIDAATTWLPLSLTRVCWVTVPVAAAAAVVCGMPAARLVTMAIAAIGALGLFWVLWRFSGGQLGFGDVRLVPMVAATAVAVSVSTVILAFVLGSILGVLTGVVARLRGSSGGFPYAPALWAGVPVAVLVQALIRGGPL